MRFLIGLTLFAMTTGASAQDRRPSHCIAIADAAPGIEFLHKASFTDPVPENEVRISYINHSMFLIQTEGGLSAVTDYNGFLGSADFVPDVATMNHAHSSHWTAFPDERIPNLLEGWGDGISPADHHLDLGEMLVRNVSTDIRSGIWQGSEPNGNSIFVFEVAGLCIGHLGPSAPCAERCAICRFGAAGRGDGGGGWRDDACRFARHDHRGAAVG